MTSYDEPSNNSLHGVYWKADHATSNRIWLRVVSSAEYQRHDTLAAAFKRLRLTATDYYFAIESNKRITEAFVAVVRVVQKIADEETR